MSIISKTHSTITYLVIAFILSGCDRIAGVIVEIEKGVKQAAGNAVEGISKNDDRENAKAICLSETAKRYAGREYKSNEPVVDGYLKYRVYIFVKKTNDELERERSPYLSGVEKFGPNSLAAHALQSVQDTYLVSCYTNNHVVVSVNRDDEQ